MARTEIPVTAIERSGVFTALTAGIADGHKVKNDGRVFFHIKNGGGAPLDVIFQIQRTVDGQAIVGTGRTEAVPNNANGEFYGPFPTGDYNVSGGDDQGMLYIDYEDGSESSLSISAYRL